MNRLNYPKIVFSFLVLLLTTACEQKTEKSVFPEASQKPTGVCQSQSLPTEFVVQWEDGRITVEHAENADQFKQNFLESRLNEIRHVEFNKRLALHNVPLAQGSAIDSKGLPVVGTEQWGIDRIEAPAVWANGYQGEGVIVGIVDSMVDISHTQLAPRILKNTAEASGVEGADDDNNGYIDDVDGYDFFNKSGKWAIEAGNDHGTHVAGIIAADPTVGKLSGVAPKAQIVPANFMDQDGSGTLSDAVLAIRYAVSRGARVVNASWGGPCPSPLLENAINELEAKGVLIVVASGNDGDDLDSTPSYPAAYTAGSQLTVAAVYNSDNMTSWSNSSFRFVQIAAPGAQILSTVPGGLYRMLDGTSMATPFVSGAAAVLMGARPKATVAQIKTALMSSVDLKEYRVASRGRLNVRKAVENLLQQLPQ